MSDIEEAIMICNELKKCITNDNVIMPITDNDSNDIIDTIDKAIDALKEKKNSRWIPVSEMLPDDMGYKKIPCYVTIKRKETNYTFTKEAYFCGGKWVWSNKKEISSKFVVTAWKKRISSEPYKGE